ncbi:MAG: hypothetical protein KDC05_11185 [Bacteroidales bacterium]|nr:hypothetical protein [Bacteroidales bacterium]
MAINYLCPHCKGYISLNDAVVFSVKASGNKRGLISLKTELGNYAVDKNPEFDFHEGEELDFYCPICHTELASDVHGKLARIIMVDENKTEFDILFSRRAGQKSTYKIIGETMEIFGDDSAEYIDFINLSMNF